MFFSVASMDRQDLINNLLVLAKSAKIFHLPVILTAVISTVFSGRITQQLLDCSRIAPIERSCINAWDDPKVVAA